MLQQYKEWLAINKIIIDNLSKTKHIINKHNLYKQHYQNYLDIEAMKFLNTYKDI